MGDAYGGPIPLCQELVDYVIDDLKDETPTLQSCRLVSKDFQRQTRVERYLFQKIVFPHLYRYGSEARSKSDLLGLAPHVRTLFVNRENRDRISRRRRLPTTATTTTTDDDDDLDISRFENLKTLGIVNAFWNEPQYTVGSALSENLTTLELSAGPSVYTENLEIPSVRKLLQFIFAFPKLSSLGLERVRLASPAGEKVDDLMRMSGPTLRRLRLGLKARANRDSNAADTFVSVLRAVAIDPSVLEELYISGYKNGIELVKSCSALRVLTLILKSVDPAKIAPIPLRHIKYLTIGFHMWDIYDIDEATLDWFRLSLLDTARPTQVKHFTLRCNVDEGGEDTWGCEEELRGPLQPIDEILSKLPLKTFTVTTSYADFEDNAVCIHHVSMVDQGIRACLPAMKKRRVGRAKHKELRSEPGWRVMEGFPILEGWYARTVYQLKGNSTHGSSHAR
ncbi:hypothetical protein BDZ89DRAFT_1160880 [Hymenopellis radicata]|nr:hypothetical protein BDZ89DRAFT_1160880 [Hymenopellis radicata]